MNKSLLVSIVSFALAASANAALKAGDNAPEFTAQASFAGKSFTYSLKDALKKGPVVVYFYPSAFTGGCNLQAHTFAENKEKFDAAGASIIGVSLDSIKRLNDFSADPNYCAGKIAVASDADGKIAKSYDLKIGAANAAAKDTRGIAIDHGFAERTTFIVMPDGKIADVIGNMTPVENVEKALQVIEKIGKK
ncbi:MAG TPA: peroxiredoxin [Steroidobacteraceae bacterium]|nr:peroxiredoxin [Steroidobacteraceae bacterium]